MKRFVEIIKRKVGFSVLGLATISLLLTSCSEEAMMAHRNKVSFYATDAAIDNAEVEAVFVTVSEIRVDGQKVDGFQKTTLEVSALTDGKTALLQDTELETDAISEITLVLDYDSTDKGNTPGTYILKTDGSIEAMSSNSSEVSITKFLELDGKSKNEIVFDFDLRKMVKEESDGDFELITKAELESAIRIVSKANTGTVEGKVDSASNVKGKAIAYLYVKGEYNATEMSAQGESKIQFKNAVNSAVIANDGSFKLAFTEEGEYEIHIFEYDDVDNDGRLEITGKLELNAKGSAGVDGFNVDANGKTDLNVGIKSIFPL